MTNEEQLIFENLVFDLLVPRLATVNIGILEAIIESQNPDPEFEADSPFASQTPLGFGEEKPAVLEILMNVTLTFSEYPEGWRDWSIYVKSWIESFGNNLVEIFTSPKHPQPLIAGQEHGREEPASGEERGLDAADDEDDQE